MNKDVLAALAGAGATIPMSVNMVIEHSKLPQALKYPLPPREIVDEIVKKTELQGIGETERRLATVAAHFGYGALMGAVYGRLCHSFKLEPVIKGSVFGIAVWTTSYLGILPALGILKPATKHPKLRNALMIRSHLVWGATLGLLENKLNRK